MSEQEVAKVVDGHGHLHILLIYLTGVHHHACVVDEHIDHLKTAVHSLCELLHRLPFGEIKLDPFNCSLGVWRRFLDLLSGLNVALLIPTSDDNVVPVSKQRLRSLKADTHIASSHDNIPFSLHQKIECDLRRSYDAHHIKKG